MPEKKIREGMVVKNREGEPLGRVISVDEEGFVLERKVVISQELRLGLEDVEALGDEEVVLIQKGAGLRGLEVPMEFVWSARHARDERRGAGEREQAGISYRMVVVTEHTEAFPVQVERGSVPSPRYVPLPEAEEERRAEEEQSLEEELPQTLH